MSDNADATPSEKKSRNSYTLEKKLKSIATSRGLDNVDKASQQEGVPRTCLMKWIEGEEKLKEAIRTRGTDTKKGNRWGR
ncbi:hypothetical protein AAVH_23371 [Aphelenchoides avenae]|nr:hypothetical protein AAVH_23371 [Aphelenchus avenae]